MGAAVTPHSGIRVSTLVLAGLAMTVVAWLGLRWLTAGGNAVPAPGWVGAARMLFLTGGPVIAGWQVRKVRDGLPNLAISPLRAARTLVLGQAGALTGSVLVGWYLANALVLLPDADVDSQRGRILPFVLHAVVALLLAEARMVLQNCSII